MVTHKEALKAVECLYNYCGSHACKKNCVFFDDRYGIDNP